MSGAMSDDEYYGSNFNNQAVEELAQQRDRAHARIAALEAELAKVRAELADEKESMAMELAENIRLFDLIGLKTEADFGYDDATKAIARKFIEMRDARDAAFAELTEAKRLNDSLANTLVQANIARAAEAQRLQREITLLGVELAEAKRELAEAAATAVRAAKEVQGG